MPRAAWILVALVLLASPVRAAKPSLTEVAEEAKKPPEQQEVVGHEEPSQTKTKEPAAPAEAPQERSSTVQHHGDGGAIGPVVGPYYGAPHGVSSVGIMDPQAVPQPFVRWRFGAVAAGGGLAADAFGGFGSAGVLVGAVSGLVSLDLRGHYTRGQFDGGVESAFENLQGFSGDLVGRLRISEDWAPVWVDVMVMGRLGRYDWDFRNPVQVAEPGGVRTYDHDGIRYRTFMGGLGVVPLRGWEWSLEITAAGGHQHFWGETREGFLNDLFENGAVFELLLEIVHSPF